MKSVFGAEYLLDSYTSEDTNAKIEWLGENCTVQKFQGLHKNEFVITDSHNKSSLYYNGVLKQTWEGDWESRNGNFDVYENGKLKISGSYENLICDDYVHFKSYSKYGLEMLIIRRTSRITVYRGLYNVEMQRHGLGIEFSETDGKEQLEGVWANDKLCRITKVFENGVMTEFSEEGNGLQFDTRIPVYIGGYCWDEDTGKFVRHGKGCLIDSKTRMAYRESTWENGKEVDGIDIINGCYKYEPISVSIHEERDMHNLTATVSDLLIEDNSFNTSISFNTYQWNMIQKITIGDYSFGKIQGITFSKLPCLESITIGNHCFTTQHVPPSIDRDLPYSFKVTDCEHLVSFKMGIFCCTNWSHGLVLENLPNLETIQIGDLETQSWNFAHSSFILHGRIN